MRVKDYLKERKISLSRLQLLSELYDIGQFRLTTNLTLDEVNFFDQKINTKEFQAWISLKKSVHDFLLETSKGVVSDFCVMQEMSETQMNVVFKAISKVANESGFFNVYRAQIKEVLSNEEPLKTKLSRLQKLCKQSIDYNKVDLDKMFEEIKEEEKRKEFRNKHGKIKRRDDYFDDESFLTYWNTE